MDWLWYLLIAAAGFALARIFFSLRKLRDVQKADNWDAKALDRLRAQGLDPFQSHDVDFFLALPSDAAGNAVMTRLEADGFAVHVKVVPESADLPISLRATLSMRLSLPDMKAASARFAALAKEQGGRYDGWAAGRSTTAAR
ncbi:MAG: ribonuclease E inhibitor RraB [Steroidobacteraceae bacterium]